MLKRLFTIGMVVCAMLLSYDASAQETKPQDFPRVGFWSNWSVGGDVLANWQSCNWMNSQKEVQPNWNWGLGANLMFQKQLNYEWAMRITLGAPRFYSFAGDTVRREGYDTVANYAQNYFVTTIGFVYSLLSSCNYNADRKCDLYAFLNGGVSWGLDGFSLNKSQSTEFGIAALYAEVGLGFSVKCCENSKFFVEASLGNCADIPDFSSTEAHLLRVGQLNANFGLGYMYNFGLTSTDAELVAQKAKLTQENFDALNGQITALETEVASSKKAEQRLQNKISELENQNEEMVKAMTTNAAADSLQQIIDNIKEEQLTYYGLPFSILYGVDEWRVPATEETKLKAIAKVMKDNPNVNFLIVGFCDYTGSDTYNQKLSEKRANEVKKQLVNRYGIAEDRLSTDGKGKSLAFGDLKLSVNRRVSFYRVIE